MAKDEIGVLVVSDGSSSDQCRKMLFDVGESAKPVLLKGATETLDDFGAIDFEETAKHRYGYIKSRSK
jgi:hypothetical protein